MIKCGFIGSSRQCIRSRVLATVLSLLATAVVHQDSRLASQPRPALQSCFLLHDEQSGRTTREPSGACSTRVTPASTFKIPHALAALDTGVVSGADHTFPYDGAPQRFERWARDHDLASAMRDSVVWYFQEIARRLGIERERAYLKAFQYGNQDASGPLTAFWLGDSLQISPEEHLAFLRRFFDGRLPVSAKAARTVRDILVQPAGRVVNAAGEHVLGGPWPPGTVVQAKTGSGADHGRSVVWLVGRVARGDRAWVFVSCVIGAEEPTAAVDLAAARLADLNVLSVPALAILE
jgi:beta-lactamase class D